MSRKKKYTFGSYAGKGGHARSHPLGPATKEKSLGAIRQEQGLSYFPEPPRGFRLTDQGKVVRDPENRTIGPISDFGSHG